MFEVIENTMIGKMTHRLTIKAPRVAKSAKAGQFVIVRVDEEGERVPFTIADVLPDIGSIALIVQSVGATSDKLKSLVAGEFVQDLLGPLGHPAHVGHYGHVLLVGGGYGAATFNLLVRGLKKEGNRVSVIVGAKSSDLIIMDEKLKALCQKVQMSTDDGSAGFHGSVIPLVEKALGEEPLIDCVFAVGPLPMMKAVADCTLKAHVKTYVSLNPIMMDGAGLCGGCRVIVNGRMRFACVDGPEFDAHQVDFSDLMQRNAMYKSFESRENCRLLKLDGGDEKDGVEDR